MTLSLDRRLLLNQETHERLTEAGLAKLANQPVTLDTARHLGLWRGESGSELYLFGLLIAVNRYMALRYFAEHALRPDLSGISLADRRHPLPQLGATFSAFVQCYPQPTLADATQPEKSERQKAEACKRLTAELFVLDTLLDNPAVTTYLDLFDDSTLNNRIDYRKTLQQVTALMETVSAVGPWSKPLPELLREPMRAAPHSLTGQMAYTLKHWGSWLPESIITELLTARAVAEEENRPRFSGPGPTLQPVFGQEDGSNMPAAFTSDTDWMANSVLLAKSIFVWLDQLSQRYQYSIRTLDQIPEEELQRLARWGFNSLWLIGIWERSSASRRIKQLRGNPEAEASAYALHAYRVADELGGEDALNNLEFRCKNHGIRLACDVVPNHTGIDSTWVKEHPDWFLQTEQPPWPGYRFTGPDLCDIPEISIRIEDGYWDHSDAAVVCEHLDHRTGHRRYIYHGNDGTQMPWNDTAQLNFLMPEVRRAMSDLIVEVAKRFRLIRFDAAMTLARKHFRRLWFPPPGGSAGVPSRSAFWMSDEDFNAAFPVEFWREVVDRINREAPDTLLIAEAFWLMESYFVRNLGMHRVYNSAFMNMLKREENAKYRRILKDTLAYNPEIMKRYVNFMNNPDEATAVEQFDKGDKYFGVATLLATLPGLPMFGHGQVEGFKEKYGMEYRRAYWDEAPDQGFIEHHESQICPLLQQRWIFAGVDNFSLYDFETTGDVNDNVYAFSNGPADRKHLIVFNNSTHSTTGRVNSAAAKAHPDNEGVAQPMPPLWKEFDLDPARGSFCRFRSLGNNLEYLCPTNALQQGLELQLGSYQHHVFYDFSLLSDADNHWQKLHQHLNGRAVTDLNRERQQLLYADLWQAFTALLDPGRLKVLVGGLSARPLTKPVRRLLNDIFAEVNVLAAGLRAKQAPKIDEASTIDLSATLRTVPQWLSELPAQGQPGKLLSERWNGTVQLPGVGVSVLGWLILHALGKVLGLDNDRDCLALMTHFGLDYAWQQATSGTQQEDIAFSLLLLRQTADPAQHPALSEDAFTSLVNDHKHQPLLGINCYRDETWFSQERMTQLVSTLAMQAGIQSLTAEATPPNKAETTAIICTTARQRLARAAAVSYRLDKFL